MNVGFMIMLDSLFKVEYTNQDAADSRENGLRFVPQKWLKFFQSLSNKNPSLRSWVLKCKDPELTGAYQKCIELFVIHRTMHRHLAGQTLRGSTTTARTFSSAETNYRDFMNEMKAIIDDTINVGIAASVEDGKLQSRLEKTNDDVALQVGVRRVNVPKNSLLQDACNQYQLPILFGCRAGCCGSCIVQVVSGNDSLSPITSREARILDVLEAEPDWRLACQCAVKGDVHVRYI